MPAVRAVAAFLLLTTFVAADELRTVDNKTITGTIVALDAKEVTLKTNDGNVSTPLENVLALVVRDPKKLTDNYTEIRLTDESVLICKEKGVAFKGKIVEATLIRSEERRVGKEWRSKRDWSSDVCSSDLCAGRQGSHPQDQRRQRLHAPGKRAGPGGARPQETDRQLYRDPIDRRERLDLQGERRRLQGQDRRGHADQIGRASCRERVEIET